jgi:DNA-directed RNA polymerase specialized sigma24 family protein
VTLVEAIHSDKRCSRAALKIDPINGEDLYQDCIIKIHIKEQAKELGHVSNIKAYFIRCLQTAFLDTKRKNVNFVELFDFASDDSEDVVNDIINDMLTEPAPTKRAIYKQQVVAAYLHLGSAAKAAKHLNIHHQSVHNAVRAFRKELKQRYDNNF